MLNLDCISVETMECYLTYLLNYALNINMYGNNVAIERAKQAVESDDFYIKYADSVLPENWSDICKQINQLKEREKQIKKLKERERLNENINGNEEREKKTTYIKLSFFCSRYLLKQLNCFEKS